MSDSTIPEILASSYEANALRQYCVSGSRPVRRKESGMGRPVMLDVKVAMASGDTPSQLVASSATLIA